ncbi:hypothetical protein [Pedosphaera parvula]|uniref:Uncharacterized protein n=1 Tax=Pedosphaera parvula (strain Ellin514) TaxID=320771 RepID=B9XGS0_PEDPL|nr:hypothetical protein [Pedosphaera parvula]EEF60841.1 hypothetical protein Cflav_PD4010 [Pedosphaera parvula Ellin514]
MKIHSFKLTYELGPLRIIARTVASGVLETKAPFNDELRALRERAVAWFKAVAVLGVGLAVVMGVNTSATGDEVINKGTNSSGEKASSNSKAAGNAGTNIFVTISPSQSLSGPTSQFKLDQPGKYTIRARRWVHHLQGDGYAQLQSGTTTITILKAANNGDRTNPGARAELPSIR